MGGTRRTTMRRTRRMRRVQINQMHDNYNEKNEKDGRRTRASTSTGTTTQTTTTIRKSHEGRCKFRSFGKLEGRMETGNHSPSFLPVKAASGVICSIPA
jgi:hypothetical protein